MSFNWKSVLFLPLLLLIVGCSQTVGVFPSEMAPQIADAMQGYKLESGNRIKVTVFNEQNLSGEFTLDASGNVAMPLIGNIPGAGHTAKELTRRIEEKLKRDGLLQQPSVAVEVQTFRPFYVLGEVRQPGEYQYSAGVTVLSAVARAGGYDYRAVTGTVVLVRNIDGIQKEYQATELTPLFPGDIVRVLERRF